MHITLSEDNEAHETMDNSKVSWHIRHKRFLIAIVVIFLFVMLLVFTHQIWLTKLAQFLIVQTDISPCDVIIMLSGGTERFRHSVDLYKQGFAPNIILNLDSQTPIKFADVQIDWRDILTLAREKGDIPETALLIIEGVSSTYDDARLSREEMQKRGFRSAIVVTSPYHTRRARMVFRKVYKDSGILLCYSPVEKSWFRVEKWWTRERELITVINESIKLVFYWLRY